MVEDIDDSLAKMIWYQDPDRYRDLFAPEDGSGAEPLVGAGSPVEEVVNDLDAVDAYFESLGDKREITGEQLLRFTGGDEEGWI